MKSYIIFFYFLEFFVFLSRYYFCVFVILKVFKIFFYSQISTQ